MFRTSPSAIVKDYLPRYRWLEWRFVHAPNKFWTSKANQQRYLTWLGKQLGFRRPDDWYALSERHVREWDGGRLLKQFGGSPSAIVKDLFPRHRWQDWRFASTPKGFWQETANQRRYLEWLGKELGFRRPTDWYAITESDLTQHYGGSLLNVYGGSVHALVTDYLPQEDWKEWLFASTPQRFWHDPDNQRLYLQWLGTQFGYQHAEDWQRLRVTDLRHHHGERLLTLFHHDVPAIVDEYLRGINIDTP